MLIVAARLVGVQDVSHRVDAVTVCCIGDVIVERPEWRQRFVERKGGVGAGSGLKMLTAPAAKKTEPSLIKTRAAGGMLL